MPTENINNKVIFNVTNYKQINKLGSSKIKITKCMLIIYL